MPAQSYTSNPLLTSYYQDKSYSIYLPAVKSSGDIYHIAAYIILCRHFNWQEPKVFIAYDEHNTFKPASRGLNFLQLLLGDKTKAELVDLSKKLKTTQQNPRDKKTRETILAEQDSSAINQKGTTALIQRAMMGYGMSKIYEILQKAFLNQESIKPITQLLETWLDEKITRITKQVQLDGNEQPFVVIHHRLSNGSNDQQYLTDKDLKEIITTLEAQGIAVFILVISGEALTSAQKSSMVKSLKLKSSRDILEVFKEADGQYAKFYHMHLLDKITAIPGFRGMIGATSGTFDVAAFMGIKCLNVHKFKDPSKLQPKAIMKHQDFRIVLQSAFMSVCSSISSFTILSWLDVMPLPFLYSHGSMPLIPKATSQIPDPNKHIERLGFNCSYHKTGEQLVVKNFNEYYPKQVEYLELQSEIATIAHNRNNLKYEEQECRGDLEAEFKAELECINQLTINDPNIRPKIY